ncbi:MAG: polyphosphate kinase 2, partial [Thiotrichaceae bacterium]
MEYQVFLGVLAQDEEDFKQLLYKRYLRYTEDEEIKPYQAELIKLQDHLEKQQQKMIIL